MHVQLHSIHERYALSVHTVAMNADISMQNSTLVVSEGTASIDVCAVINGVAGSVEEEVTAILTLTGSTKAGNRLYPTNDAYMPRETFSFMMSHQAMSFGNRFCMSVKVG